LIRHSSKSRRRHSLSLKARGLFREAICDWAFHSSASNFGECAGRLDDKSSYADRSLFPKRSFIQRNAVCNWCATVRGVVDNVEAYDPSTDMWSTKSPLPVALVHWASPP